MRGEKKMNSPPGRDVCQVNGLYCGGKMCWHRASVVTKEAFRDRPVNGVHYCVKIAIHDFYRKVKAVKSIAHKRKIDLGY